MRFLLFPFAKSLNSFEENVRESCAAYVLDPTACWASHPLVFSHRLRTSWLGAFFRQSVPHLPRSVLSHSLDVAELTRELPGSAFYKGGVQPCKISPSLTPPCRLGYGGLEVSHAVSPPSSPLKSPNPILTKFPLFSFRKDSTFSPSRTRWNGCLRITD